MDTDCYAELHERIDALCERARRGGGPELLEAMNEVLSEGYARALLDERRIAAGGHCAGARSVQRLRAHLADMHERYLALSP